jgi:hypothetical protein
MSGYEGDAATSSTDTCDVKSPRIAENPVAVDQECETLLSSDASTESDGEEQKGAGSTAPQHASKLHNSEPPQEQSQNPKADVDSRESGKQRHTESSGSDSQNAIQRQGRRGKNQIRGKQEAGSEEKHSQEEPKTQKVQVIQKPHADYRAWWLDGSLHTWIVWFIVIPIAVALALAVGRGSSSGSAVFSDNPRGCHSIQLDMAKLRALESERCLCAADFAAPTQRVVVVNSRYNTHKSRVAQTVESISNGVLPATSPMHVVLSNPSFAGTGGRDIKTIIDEKSRDSVLASLKKTGIVFTTGKPTHGGADIDWPVSLEIEYFRTLDGYCVADAMKIDDYATVRCVYLCMQQQYNNTAEKLAKK